MMNLLNIAFTTKSAKTEIEKFMFKNISLYKDEIDSVVVYTDYNTNYIRTMFSYYLNAKMQKCLVLNASYINEIAHSQHRKCEQIVAMIIKYIKDNKNTSCENNFFLNPKNKDAKSCWSFIDEVLNK